MSWWWLLLLLLDLELPQARDLVQHEVYQVELVLRVLNILHALLYVSDFLVDSLIDFQEPISDSLHGRKIRGICHWNMDWRHDGYVGVVQVDSHTICQLCHLLSALREPQTYRSKINVAHRRPGRGVLAGLAGLPIKLCVLHAGRWAVCSSCLVLAIGCIRRNVKSHSMAVICIPRLLFSHYRASASWADLLPLQPALETAEV